MGVAKVEQAAAEAPSALAQGLACRGLGLGYAGRSVLEGLDLDFAAGTWTAIVGPNGAGKSTLLRALAALQAPLSGQVLLNGRPIEEYGPRQRAQCLAWLGQAEEGGALAQSRVEDVVMLGRLPWQNWLGQVQAADRAAVEEALGLCNLLPLRARSMGSLSGGERQRVLLARALAGQAAVLLLDEPLAHLDVQHQWETIALLRRLARRGHTVLSVLHELGWAAQADALLVLDSGRCFGPAALDDAAQRQALLQAFAGRVRVLHDGAQWAVLPALLPSSASCGEAGAIK